MQLIHTLDRSVALCDEARDIVLWEYVYRGRPKPFVHPLRTLSGHCLSNFEPHDHVWHRGLWFTIKFINGENFWEENALLGTQETLGAPALVPGEGGRIDMTSELRWLRPDGKQSVFHEQRRISHVPLDAQSYALDWETRLTAEADLLLDRTPYTTWGGYGGLIFRGTRNWQQTRHLFPDGSTTQRPIGVRHTWCDLAGRLDGGLEQSGGVTFFDHPDNPRHPSPWYGGGGDINYTNAAFLFHEPMNLARGQTLYLRYRVLVHDGIWPVEQLETAYQAYLAGA